MPWSIKKSSKCPSSRPWAVIKNSDGAVVGCHKSKAGAIKQHIALKMNVHVLLDADQVTELLQISRTTLYRYVKKGRMPKPVKNWGEPRWKASQIYDFMEHETGE